MPAGLDSEKLIKLVRKEGFINTKDLAVKISQKIKEIAIQMNKITENDELEKLIHDILKVPGISHIVVRDVFNIGLARYYTAAKTLVERFGEEGKTALCNAMRKFFRERGKMLAQLYEEPTIPELMEAYRNNFGVMGVEMEIISKSEDNGEMRVKSCPFLDMWRREKAKGATGETLDFLEHEIEVMGWTPIAEGFNPQIESKCECTMWDGKPYCRITFRKKE